MRSGHDVEHLRLWHLDACRLPRRPPQQLAGELRGGGFVEGRCGPRASCGRSRRGRRRRRTAGQPWSPPARPVWRRSCRQHCRWSSSPTSPLRRSSRWSRRRFRSWRFHPSSSTTPAVRLGGEVGLCPLQDRCRRSGLRLRGLPHDRRRYRRGRLLHRRGSATAAAGGPDQAEDAGARGSRARATTPSTRTGALQSPVRSSSGQTKPRSIAQTIRSNGHLTASAMRRRTSAPPQTTRSSTAKAALAIEERNGAGVSMRRRPSMDWVRLRVYFGFSTLFLNTK